MQNRLPCQMTRHACRHMATWKDVYPNIAPATQHFTSRNGSKYCIKWHGRDDRPTICNVTDAAMPNPSHPQPQNTKSSQTDLATSIVVIVPATQNKLIATRSPPRTTLCVDYPSRFTRLSSNRHFSETQKHTKIYRIIVKFILEQNVR